MRKLLWALAGLIAVGSASSRNGRALAEALGQKRDGIVLNAHYEGDGRVIFGHACKLGCEGIV
jgi:ATP-dependent DNA ligase